MRTLLVDYQTAFARAVQGALVDCGFAVDVTRTVDEAAAALDCACYDILLLELALPDGDGLGWLKQLRRSGKSLPAMVISGLDRRIASFNGGADDFLPKPLSTVELIAPDASDSTAIKANDGPTHRIWECRIRSDCPTSLG